MTDPWACRLKVNLEVLAANFRSLQRQAGGAQVAPVVKADAYGLGADRVARKLRSEGASHFFVARVSEGEALRTTLGRSGQSTIYVFDGCPPGSAQRLAGAGLTPVLNSPQQVSDWVSYASQAPLALHVDTGINRLGLTLEEAKAIAAGSVSQDLSVQLVMSHLACAVTPRHPMNRLQLTAFEGVRALWPDAVASLANTDGLFLGSEYHHQMVRPGLGLYGGGPFGKSRNDLGAVATLEAPILQLRHLHAGDAVGYGALWRAQRETTIAIIAAGFADGVLRSLGPRGYGWFAGQARPFLGRISMDLLAIDVTDCPDAEPGAMVQLLGGQVPLHDVAKRANTSPYEILTRGPHRVLKSAADHS